MERKDVEFMLEAFNGVIVRDGNSQNIICRFKCYRDSIKWQDWCKASGMHNSSTVGKLIDGVTKYDVVIWLTA